MDILCATKGVSSFTQGKEPCAIVVVEALEVILAADCCTAQWLYCSQKLVTVWDLCSHITHEKEQVACVLSAFQATWVYPTFGAQVGWETCSSELPAVGSWAGTLHSKHSWGFSFSGCQVVKQCWGRDVLERMMSLTSMCTATLAQPKGSEGKLLLRVLQSITVSYGIS